MPMDLSPLYAVFSHIGESAVAYSDNVLMAIVLLVVGLIVGKIVGAVTEEIMLKTRVDRYVKAKKAEFKLSHVLSVVFSWVVYLWFIKEAVSANVLGLTVLESFIGSIVNFLPHIVGAVVVVIAGYALARYVEEIVRESKAIYAGLMSRVLFFFVVYVAIAIGLGMVPGLKSDLVDRILLIIVGSVGLGFAIAMGLGLRGLFEEVSDELGKKVARRLKSAK